MVHAPIQPAPLDSSGVALVVPIWGSGEVVATTLIDAVDGPIVLRRRWHQNKKGYAVGGGRASEPRSIILLHRLILGLGVGNPLQADHINRCRRDNRRANLRAVTQLENSRNLSPRPGSTTGVRNVFPKKNDPKYVVAVKKDYRLHYFGRYHTIEEAARVAAEARRALFGDAA